MRYFSNSDSAKALREVAQNADGPLAELGGPRRVHAEADGDDDVEVIKSGEVAFTVAGSIPEFPDNCHLVEFLAGENILQVLADRAHIHLKQRADQFLRQPYGSIFHANFDAFFTRLRGEDEKLGGAVADLYFLFLLMVLIPFHIQDDLRMGCMQVSFFNGLFQAIRPRHPHMLAEAQNPRFDIAGVGDGDVAFERPNLAADHLLLQVPFFFACP